MITMYEATATPPPFTANLMHTDDADEHAACLREWGQCYDQLTAGRFSGRFEEFCFGAVQIFRERANQVIHESGRPWVGSHTIGVPVEIDGPGWFSGEVLDMNAIISLRGGDEFDFRTPRQHEILAVTTQADALYDYALQVDHRDLNAELSGSRLISARPERAERLRDFLSTVMTSLRATPDLVRHAQTRKALEHAVFATLLETVAPDAPVRATPSGNTRRIVVERAREFMRNHIDEPITVADLYVHLRVSRRTLQYSFQDVLDLNPVKFLRAMRLNGVRRELKRADASRETVADIAARWGFWHLSHFAADYRAMFYELPSETLKRGMHGDA